MGGNDPRIDNARPPQPTPPPVPVAPLATVSYASAGMAAHRQRPGGLVALGIISIVLGIVGMIAHVLSGVFLAAFKPEPLPSPPPRATVTPAPTDLPPPYIGDLFGEAGLPRPLRERAVSAIEQRVGTLSADRRIMLRQLLGECGVTIFGQAALDPSADLGKTILEAERLGAGPDGVGSLGTQWFRTNAGTVLIDDGLARFIAVGQQIAVRGTCVLGESGQPKRVSHVAIAQDLDALRTQPGEPLTPRMAGVLARDVLQGSAAIARHLSDERHEPAYRRAFRVREIDGGTLEIAEGARKSWLLPNGALIRDPLPHLDPRTGMPRVVTPPAPTAPKLGPSLPARLFFTSCAEMIVGTVLAVFLIACGFWTFSDSPDGAMLHARWAHLKLASIAVFTVPSALTSLHIAAKTNAALAGTPSAWAAASTEFTFVTIVFGVAFQLAYPLIVLRVLRSPAIRAFYTDRGGLTTALSVPQRADVRLRVDGLLGSRGGRFVVGLVVAILVACAFVSLLAPTEGEPWWAGATGRTTLAVLTVLAVTCCIVGLRRTRGFVVNAIAALALTIATAMLTASPPAVAQRAQASYQDVTRTLYDAVGAGGAPDAAADAKVRAWSKAGEPQLFGMLSSADSTLRQAAAAYLGENVTDDIPREGRAKLMQSIEQVREIARADVFGKDAELGERARVGAIVLLVVDQLTCRDAIGMLNDPKPTVARAAGTALARAPWGNVKGEMRKSLAAAVAQRKQSLERLKASADQLEPLLRIEARLRDEPEPVRKPPASRPGRFRPRPPKPAAPPPAPPKPRPTLPPPQAPATLGNDADWIEPLRQAIAAGRPLDDREIDEAITLAARLEHGREYIAALLLSDPRAGDAHRRRWAASFIVGEMSRPQLEQLAARAVMDDAEAHRLWARELLDVAAEPLDEASRTRRAQGTSDATARNAMLGPRYGYGKLIDLTLLLGDFAATSDPSARQQIAEKISSLSDNSMGPQTRELVRSLTADVTASDRPALLAEAERRWTLTADWSSATSSTFLDVRAGSALSPVWGAAAGWLTLLVSAAVLGTAWLARLAHGAS